MPLYCTKPLQIAEGRHVYICAQAERMHVTVGDGKKLINITPGAFVQAGDVLVPDGLMLRFSCGYLGMEYSRPVNGICYVELDNTATTDSLRIWVENPTPTFVHVTTDGTYRIIHLHDEDIVKRATS